MPPQTFEETWRTIRHNVKTRLKKSGNPRAGNSGLIYHYTTADSLEGILGTKSMWATHARYLNDPEEHRYGMSIVKSALHTTLKNSSKNKLVWSVLEFALNNLDSDYRVDEFSDAAYFLSFSRRRDDLSQFRAYSDSGRGYCIGTDFRTLKRNIDSHSEKYATKQWMVPVKMIYDRKQAEELVRDCIHEVLSPLKVRRSGSKADATNIFGKWLMNVVYVVSIRFKQSELPPEIRLPRVT